MGEAALNDLEGYIYSVKGKIQEQEEVMNKGTELEDWLYEAEAKTADVATFKAKHRELRKLAEPIFDRFIESTARPEAVATARKTIITVREKLAEWPTSRPWVNETEIAKVLEMLKKAEDWIDEKEAAQGTVAASEEPVFRSEDVPKQLSMVAREFERLLKKPKPAPPKVEKTNSAMASNSTNGDSTINSNSTTGSAGDNSTTTQETADEKVKVNIKVEDGEDTPAAGTEENSAEAGEAAAAADTASTEANVGADAAGKGEL